VGGKAVTIHSLDHACTALSAARELNVPVTLVSAPGAAAYAGVGWFRALTDEAHTQYPDVSMTPILDCASAAGDALAAIREGLQVIRFSGKRDVKAKVMDIARQSGVSVVTRRAPSLDLGDVDSTVADLTGACRDWLSPKSSP
jgi:fructose/tagatose bisphosphate aldolase